MRKGMEQPEKFNAPRLGRWTAASIPSYPQPAPLLGGISCPLPPPGDELYNLSPNFTIEDLSQTAIRDLQARNTRQAYRAATKENLARLALDALEPIYEKFGDALVILDAFRTDEVQKALGEKGRPEHLAGRACTLQVLEADLEEVFQWIAASGDVGWVELRGAPENRPEWLFLSVPEAGAALNPAARISSFPVAFSFGASDEDDYALSKNFSFYELTSTGGHANLIAANRAEARLEPHASNLARVATSLLQPLRDHFARSVRVNSAFRGKTLNDAVGGSKTSQHLVGEAADLIIPGLDLKEIFDYVRKMRPFEYGQLCLEGYEPKTGRGWIHLSLPGKHRYEDYIAERPEFKFKAYTGV